MLPKQSTPIYNLVVPSTKKSVKYRPFLVKERNSLMVAHESEDITIMVDTLKEVISSCVTGIDVSRLSVFDLEYIFIKMRSVSSSEKAEFSIVCDEESCKDNEKAIAEVVLDLTKVEVQFPEGHTTNIPLYDKVGVVMLYPQIDLLKRLSDLSEVKILMESIISCIDYIYDDKEIHYAKDYTAEELMDFLNNLTDEQLMKIAKFFMTQPKLSHEVAYICPVCETKKTKLIEGLQSFF